MMKTLTAILLLAVSTIASSNHLHIWVKQNEMTGTNSYGQQVTICNWTCQDYATGQTHYAQTQGYGYCSMPSP